MMSIMNIASGQACNWLYSTFGIISWAMAAQKLGAAEPSTETKELFYSLSRTEISGLSDNGSS
jgi:hypothetical protein